MAAYAVKAERGWIRWSPPPIQPSSHPAAAHPAGRELQRQIKAWRGRFFIFLAACRVLPANNGSEQEIRPSVVFRKVTNGFRSNWGPGIHAGYRSVTGTARRQGQSA